MKILVVEDEPQIRRALVMNLRAREYKVVEAPSGELAVQLCASENPDLVLLDLGLPGISGLEVLAAIRRWSDVPVIVVTVRDDPDTKVGALDAGADDYVTKPFGMAELLARVRAALRRFRPEPETPTVSTTDWTMDVAAHTITSSDGVRIHLTPIEWAIACALAVAPGRLVSQRQLTDAVWGPTARLDPNLLRVHLTHIRRKLEPDPSHPRYFHTEHGVGYRFTPEGGDGGESAKETAKKS
jgi:two-component system KDP operon response regulator KdpE